MTHLPPHIQPPPAPVSTGPGVGQIACGVVVGLLLCSVLGIGAVLLLGGGVAYVATLPSPTPLTGRIGTPLMSGTLRITVQRAMRPATITGYAPLPGTEFLLLDMLLENTGADALPVSPHDLHVTDAAGTYYAPYAIGTPPVLHAGTLPARTWVRGSVAFHIPPAARGLVVQYAPLDDSRRAPPLRFRLE